MDGVLDLTTTLNHVRRRTYLRLHARLLERCCLLLARSRGVGLLARFRLLLRRAFRVVFCLLGLSGRLLLLRLGGGFGRGQGSGLDLLLGSLRMSRGGLGWREEGRGNGGEGGGRGKRRDIVVAKVR